MIGVLLPLRLETRFYRPQVIGQPWRMRLRIIPNHAAIDRHNPEATAEELDDVERMWQQAGGQLNSDVGEAAWRGLTAITGPARAAWLARTFPPLPPDANGEIHIERPPQPRTHPRPNLIRGLPEQLQVWMARGGNPPVLVDTLVVDPAAAELEIPDPDIPDNDSWWQSFAAAAGVGLATEIDLGPFNPNNIDVLYVCGLSQEEPDTLFQAHRDFGALSLLPMGTPTNAIDGQDAVDLGQDPEAWRLRVLQPALGEPGTEKISQALTGQADALGPLPYGHLDHPQLNQWLVQALWPALWGHSLKDIWGLGSGVHDAGLWAGDALIPEGPLPALRIGDQPYGVLPTTSLEDWRASPGDPEVEGRIRSSLIRMRAAWANFARAQGNVSDADTEKLLDLMEQTASSNGYAWRWFLPLEFLYMLLGVFGNGFQYFELVDWWEETLQEVLSYPVSPQRRYASVGWPQDITMPLVEPDNLPDGMTFKEALENLLTVDPGFIAGGVFALEFFDGDVPNSLLYRLLMFALSLSGAEKARADDQRRFPILEPVSVDAETPTLLETDADLFTPSNTNTPENQIHIRIREAIAHLAELPVEEIERAFKTVLDTAIYRIDPWITAFAWRRLQALQKQGPNFRLGMYGWVDNPKPGQPGPTEGGLLHAPSQGQCYTSIVLRDRALYDPEPARWEMNLNSQVIRMANRLAGEVRIGRHIQEALGSEVERVVGDPDAIANLRQNFAIRDEHAGRRVCDGQAVLAAESADLGLNAEQLAGLEPLRVALDAYGDLLVAEAAHHVVNGRADIAGAAMDAAAGLTAPPSLEVLQTPRSGRTIASTVVFCLPNVPAPPVSAVASPTQLADPAVAAWLVSQTGLPTDDAVWSWQVTKTDDTVESVNLAALGLAPWDTSSMSRKTLSDLALAVVADSVEVDEASPGIHAHSRIRQLANLMGSRPAIPADVILNASPTDEGAVVTELRARYQTVHDACNLALNLMALAATDNEKQAALLQAFKWGVAPLTEANPTLDDQLAAASAALTDRLSSAPQPADLSSQTAEEVARALVELATPEGRYPILGRVDFTTVPTDFSLDIRPDPDAPNPIDLEWLSTVATVRAPMARLEIFQLEALLANSSPPLHAWSNRPDDVWQSEEPPDPETGRPPDTRLIIIYGAQDVLAAPATVAAGLVDHWTEVVPAVEMATTAGFGFNAPAARAPQAILLAVPPDEAQPLNNDTLVKILSETRELAHARMAKQENINPYRGAVPTAMLTGSGNPAVELI